MKKELLFLAALCLAAVQAWGQTTVAQGTCGAEAGGSNLTWTLTSDGTLTISGTGDMADFLWQPTVGRLPDGHPHRRGAGGRDERGARFPQRLHGADLH